MYSVCVYFDLAFFDVWGGFISVPLGGCFVSYVASYFVELFLYEGMGGGR